MIRLNVGSGHLPLRGFTNIDIRDVFAVDVVHDVTKLKEIYDDNSVDEIFAKDILEHVGKNYWKQTLQDWVDILKPGGVLKIRIPDLLKIIKQWNNSPQGRLEFDRLVQLTFADQDVPENTHNVGFTQEHFKSDLEEMDMKVLDTWYDGGRDMRFTAVKGDKKPLVPLDHDDYNWKELQIMEE